MARNRKGIEVAEIVLDQCIGCQICIGECPVGAIELGADGVAHVDPEACIGCGKCAQVCPVGAVDFDKGQRRPLAAPQRGARAATDRDYQGVGVFIETAGSLAMDVAWELTGKARELADRLGTKVIGFILGDGVDPVAREAIAYGCDVVHVVDHPGLGTYVSRPFGTILADLCKSIRPAILLMGATSLGRDLAGWWPRGSARA